MAKDVDSATLRKWRELLYRLIGATNKGVISWNRTASPSVYITYFGGVVIFFGERVRDDGSEIKDYYVRIANDQGEEIDEFEDRDLDEESAEPYVFRDMRDFFQSLKRKISGADSVLDKLIAELPDP